jgi:hypothetical protein
MGILLFAAKTRLFCSTQPTRQARHGMSVALAKYNHPWKMDCQQSASPTLLHAGAFNPFNARDENHFQHHHTMETSR